MKQMSVKKVLLPIAGAWGTLGFVRGMQHYDYEYKTNLHKRETYMYLDKFRHGVFGSFTYLNPVMTIFMAYKEVYRCEVCLRNLETDKQSEYYKRLF